MLIDPFELLFWTFRRSETDVVNLYDTLSDVMRLSTGGEMLNFGYWDQDTINPIEAQTKLCKIFASLADFDTAEKILDVGCGFSAPAIQWKSMSRSLEISCMNLNFNQLKQSLKSIKQRFGTDEIPDGLRLLNATSTLLPFETDSFDRVVALESAHHMKPFASFVTESKRILKKDGVMALAIPVVSKKTHIAKLGILSITWSSERYSLDYIQSSLINYGFDIERMEKIGHKVYSPLANYYTSNRESIKKKILSKYPSYVEKILFHSLLKMKQVSEKNVIDYILIKCKNKP